jgi:hypothetical protein
MTEGIIHFWPIIYLPLGLYRYQLDINVEDWKNLTETIICERMHACISFSLVTVWSLMKMKASLLYSHFLESAL